MILYGVNQQIKTVQRDFMLRQGGDGLQRWLTSQKLMAFLNIFCKLKFFPLAAPSNWACIMSLSYPVDFVGIGVLLVLMTTGRVALYDPVGLLMSQRRKMLAGQILREGAPATLS